MYTPKHFSIEENESVKKLIKENSFVNVVSFPNEEWPFINHLPLIFSNQSGEDNILIGHMAKRNPQWMHFEANPKCMVVVNGPHAYITPKWYKSGRDVPTWNYAVAQLYGRVELLKDFNSQVSVLEKLTNYFENGSENPWKFELPEDLLEPKLLTSAIVSFKFHIEKIDAKFKLSQNRPESDRVGVVNGLKQRKDDLSQSILSLMQDQEKRRPKV